MIDKLRCWIRDYFQNDFHYESLLFMQLNKVRDYIFNQQIAAAQNANNYFKEYDLVVKVDDVREQEPNQENESNTIVMLRISDMSQV